MRNLGFSVQTGLAAAILIATTSTAFANGSPSVEADRRIEALERKIQQLEQKLGQQDAAPATDTLEQKVLVLERKNEIAEEAAAVARKTQSATDAAVTTKLLK